MAKTQEPVFFLREREAFGLQDANQNRTLLRSHPGGVEFDIDPGPLSDRESEKDYDSDSCSDWETDAMQIRERIASQESQKKQRNANEEKKDNQPPTSFHDNENRPLFDSVPKRGILKKNADTYELEKYKKNAMIIFNHKDFLCGSNKTRAGTLYDEASLKETFEKFGFEVEPHLDLRKKDLLRELKTFCSKDFTQYGCVCVAIMTHGSKYGYLRAFDTRYSEHEIIEYLNVRRNPTLLGKPIIILIQACRGDQPAAAVNPDTQKLEGGVEMDNDDHYNLPTESDMLIFHSCYIGRPSASEPLKGSWFIQTLCEKIARLAPSEDFDSICRVVRKEIAQDKEYETVNSKKQPVVAKQMPVVTTTLTRLLYLRKYEGDFDKNKEDEKVLMENTSPDGDNKKWGNDMSIQVATCCASCDEYLEYLKKCLRLFISENPKDEVALSILRIAEKVEIGNGNKYLEIKLIVQYLVKNKNEFKNNEMIFLRQPICCREVQPLRDARQQNFLCCNIC